MYQFLDLRLFLAFMVSAVACAAIMALFTLTHRRWLRECDSKAVQSAHSRPTPRIGGVAIVLALVVSAVFVPEPLLPGFLAFCLALVPVFVAGLCEDLGRHVPPRYRLAAAAVSSLLVVVLFQTWLPRTDIFLLDPLMAIAPFAIAMTVLMGATACNGFNLIDGLNGMAAGTAIVTALGLAAIAVQAGDEFGVQAGLLIVAVLLGFLLFNYPLGRIFLGDAGAYSVGFILFCLAIYLMVRMPDLSGVALLLVFFWPTADTIFSIYRRSLRRRAIGQPDRLHYHQLVMRALEVIWLGRSKRHIANPVATAILMPMVAAPVIVGVAFWNNTAAAAIALTAFAVVFAGSYIIGIRLAPRLRRTNVPAFRLVPGE